MRYTQGWWGNLRKGDHWEDLDIWGRLIFELDHKDKGWEVGVD
jgi:hypothetical protein